MELLSRHLSAVYSNHAYQREAFVCLRQRGKHYKPSSHWLDAFDAGLCTMCLFAFRITSLPSGVTVVFPPA